MYTHMWTCTSLFLTLDPVGSRKGGLMLVAAFFRTRFATFVTMPMPRRVRRTSAYSKRVPRIRLGQSYISKGIWRQGIGSFVRNSSASTLCPVVICPCLCTSDLGSWETDRRRCPAVATACRAPETSNNSMYAWYVYMHTYIHVLVGK